MRVFFVFDCFAAGVDPEDGDHAVLVGCVDELGSFGEHVGFVFAAKVDGVADSGNLDSAVGEVGDLVNGPELGADRVFLGDDACAAEVVVEVFDLLVTGKQHEAAGSAGDHGVVLDIAFLHILGNVKRYLHISHGVLVGVGEG